MLLNNDYIANFEIFPKVECKLAAVDTSKNFFTFFGDLFLRFEKLFLEVIVKLTLESVPSFIAF